ncbi:MAG: Scramblase-domain-containing protein [Benniella sp.]|nr:MAG: Scramblase-domain-containing protein [Benniella sp.]
MSGRIHSVVSSRAAMLLAQSRSRLLVARPITPLRSLRSSQYQYSSLRRRGGGGGGGGSQGSRSGRITARTSAPSRAKALSESASASEASPIAGAAVTSAFSPNVAATPQEQAPSHIVQGLDIAATPAVVPEDPFGVLQPHDTASKLLSQPALIMTRQIEMMNVLVGFEQANRYAIVDPSGTPVGYIVEEDTSMVKAMSRQVFRTHRPFKASVLDLEGNVVLKIHRPFAFINSRIMISSPDDRLIGEVQQEWHLVRRRYNLFTIEQPDPATIQKDDKTTAISAERDVTGRGMNRQQFARIDGGFLALDFDMQDEEGRRIASVNRNFVGFARELFTDSGQYALRFDAAVIQDLQQEQGLGATPAAPLTSLTSSSNASEQDMQRAKEIQANKDEIALAQLESRGGLTLDQRAIMLACAVSIDFDYFSRHSGHGGIMPVMMPYGHVPSNSSSDGMEGAGGAVAGGVAGEAAGRAMEGGGMPPAPSAPPSTGSNWGDDLPTGTPTNEWGEEVWAEDSQDSGDSGDSWLGGLGGFFDSD